MFYHGGLQTKLPDYFVLDFLEQNSIACLVMMTYSFKLIVRRFSTNFSHLLTLKESLNYYGCYSEFYEGVRQAKP